jgi:hypothetical protein
MLLDDNPDEMVDILILRFIEKKEVSFDVAYKYRLPLLLGNEESSRVQLNGSRKKR